MKFAGVALGMLSLTVAVTGLSSRSLIAAQSAASPAEAPKVAPLTAADAKPLLGDWIIAAESPQGPVTFTLTLKSDAAQTVGTISSDMMAETPISDIAKYGDSVLLRYSFDYQGNPISAVITLTPSGDTMKAVFDFADGAFTMPGTATRKKVS
jgi:hypothetical protein